MFDERNEFIDQLLLKYRISLFTVADFAKTHRSEMQQAGKIFDLKTERDEKLCLAVFRLISEEYSAAISECFCAQYKIASSLDDIFFDQNKLFLISAFIYNSSFFARSWNLCGIIISHLAYQAELRDEPKKPQAGTVIVVFFQQDIEVLSASSADEVLQPIWSKDIDQNGIQGKLQILANDNDDAGMLQFCFTFKEYYSEPPYYLSVHYKTNGDNIEHTAELNVIDVNNADNGELIIASARQNGVRYKDGFASLEVHKNE